MGVGKAETLAFGSGGEEDRAHGGANSDAVGVHITSEELHGVVNREACGHGSSRGVDVDVDVLLGVRHLQEEQLRNDGVCHEVIDRSSDEDDAVLEETRVDVEGPLPSSVLFDDSGDEMVVLRGGNLGGITHFLVCLRRWFGHSRLRAGSQWSY